MRFSCCVALETKFIIVNSLKSCQRILCIHVEICEYQTTHIIIIIVLQMSFSLLFDDPLGRFHFSFVFTEFFFAENFHCSSLRTRDFGWSVGFAFVWIFLTCMLFSYKSSCECAFERKTVCVCVCMEKTYPFRILWTVNNKRKSLSKNCPTHTNFV